MIRRILAVVGIVGLAGAIGRYHWPSAVAQSEQATVPAVPPAEAPVARIRAFHRHWRNGCCPSKDNDWSR